MAVFIAWFEARGAQQLFADAGRRCDGRTLGRFGAAGDDLGGGGGAARLDRAATGFRGRSTPTGRMCMSGRRIRRSGSTGAEPLTQFGRMCATLGIQIIPASSPQAKGRIERNHGTQQDRLVKKLRRRGHRRRRRRPMRFSRRPIGRDHNARFAQPPASADDFHVRRPPRACSTGFSARGDAHRLQRLGGALSQSPAAARAPERPRRRAAPSASAKRVMAADDSLSRPGDAWTKLVLAS